MPEAPLPNCLPPDSVASTQAGMHSGIPTPLLAPNQLAFAVNVVNRGGYAHTRPPYRKLARDYATVDVQINLRAAWQGAAFYASIGPNPSCFVTAVGGRTFRWIVRGQRVTVDELTPPLADNPLDPDLNDPTRPQVWMAQGQDFLVIQDGQSNPFFFDGGAMRRSRGSAGQELPPGRQVHYSNGRFITALTDGISYIAGDLVYSRVSGTAAYNYRDAILYTKENASILAGRAFAVPLTAGRITSLFTTAVSDTSLGQGPLQVATTNGVFSVNLPLDATQWTTTQQPSSVVALPNGGPTGFYGVTNVNGDAWYRAPDGLRSFLVARRDFNTWVQTPLSFEMHRILPYDQQSLLYAASCVNFNNRLLATCSPYASSGRGIAHRGLVALDFSNISSITQRAQPSYDGLWTGMPIMQVVKGTIDGVERCFAFAIDANNDFCLYEIAQDDASYFDYDGAQDVAQECWIESRSLFGMEAQSERVTQPLKKLETADLFFSQLLGASSQDPPGRIPISVAYRDDQYPFWVDWTSFNLCAQSCYTPEGCSQPLPVQQQFATFKRLPSPGDSVCNPMTGRPHRFAYAYEVKLAWAGRVTLHRLNLWVTGAPSTRNTTCLDQTCAVLAGCLDNPFSYVIEPGDGTGGLIEWDVGAGAPVWDTDAGSTITVH